jgi:hypothetical protein
MWEGARDLQWSQTACLMSLVANIAGNKTKPADFMPQSADAGDTRVSAAEFKALAQEIL